MNLRRAELRPLATFLALALTINIVASIATRSIADPSRRMIVATGASFDVIFVVSALYYWLLVRPAFRTPASLFLIALAGVFRAAFLFPAGTTSKMIAMMTCEVGFIALVICLVRHSRGILQVSADPDVLVRLQNVVAIAIPFGPLAHLLAYELCVWYYALGAWRRPQLPPDSYSFTVHERSGKADLLAVAAIGSLFEILPVHLLLRRWSPTAAWVAPAISLYGAVWLMALSRSFSLRPTLVARDFLAVRFGLLFNLRLIRGDVRGVQRSESLVTLELTHPMVARGPMGIPKRLERVQITPDDSSGFFEAVTSWLDAE
jgi:hypothetical protein